VYRRVVYWTGQLCCEFFYCVLVGCLVDSAAMLWVHYCVPAGCLVDREAKL
jgi:hypothetical protein